MATATIQQLREAVNEIDCMSQTSFTEIATFAKLALNLLETPRAYENQEALACILGAIWAKSKDAENYINVMAEGVACNFKNEAALRRADAHRKARESALSGRA